MYGIYANIWGILMGSMLPYIAYMDPRGNIAILFRVNYLKVSLRCHFLDASCPFFSKDFCLWWGHACTGYHWLFLEDSFLINLVWFFLFSISYMGCHPSHWRTHIFQDGFLNHQAVMTGRKFFRAACSFNPFVRRMVGPRIPSWSYSSRQLKVKLI